MKTPTRSPTNQAIETARLAGLGLDVEDAADGETVSIEALVELAEDRGKPVSHFLAAVPLATELRVAPRGPTTVKVCAGNCQQWGALDLLEHLVERKSITLAPVACLDRCDLAPACEIHGEHGQLVVAPATTAKLDEALAALVE